MGTGTSRRSISSLELIYSCIYVYICVYMCIYVYISVYKCIFMALLLFSWVVVRC